MDQQAQMNYWMRLAGTVALGMLALFLLVATVYAFESYRFIGSGVAATNTISVTGDGEVFAVPDTATFSVSVLETAKDVTTAQTAMTEKANAIIAYIKSGGVDEKDIQTTEYSINPHYEWSQTVCPAGSYCPGKQTLTGYDVSETLTIKVRDTKKAGELLAGVGSRGATNVSGLSFTIADQDELEAEARDKAIEKAKTKADALARSLGVRVVRVVGFQESAEYPIRAQYAKTSLGMGAADAAAPVPEIATGQNKITSNVTVTYEVR